MRVYENIVIGSFLFELGVRMGKERPDLEPISANLLQQTPMDQTLGDVLLANAATSRLIEFKREQNTSSKETKKLTMLEKGFSLSPDEDFYRRISREVHWYVEIDGKLQDSDRSFESRVMPYLDFMSPKTQISLSEFAKQAATDACKPVDEKRAKAQCGYIEFVCKQWRALEAKDGSTDRRSSPAALLIAVSSKGEVRWIVVNEFRHLYMQRVALEQELGIRLEPKFDIGFGIE